MSADSTPHNDLFASYVDTMVEIGDDPVRQAYLRSAYRRQARGGPFWETEAGFIIACMFLLCVVLPIWLLWKAWQLVDPKWRL